MGLWDYGIMGLWDYGIDFMVSLKIGRDKNLLLEIILSTIFYDRLLFEVTNNNKKVYYSIFPNRLSFKKQRVDDKIAMPQEHYSNEISIKNPISCFSVLTPALYIILFFKTLFSKSLIPSQWILAFREKIQLNSLKLKAIN